MTDDRPNIFGALRWLAALAVILDHAYALQGVGGVYERVTGVELGWSAVVVFFTLSGFLICRSALRREASEFWLARLTRILPALLVCTTLTAMTLASVTALPLGEYVRAPQTLRFVLGTGTLVSTEYALPGVFDGHRIGAANGSLWTLRYEVACYLLIFCLCWAARRGAWRLGPILIGCIVLCALGCAAMAVVHGAPTPAVNLAELALPFAVGAWFALRGSSPPDRWIVGVAIGAAILLSRTPLRVPAAAGALALATIALAFCGSAVLAALSRFPDYSYGIYIYAFPIQQLLLLAAPQVHPLAHALAAALLVLVPAGLSWHCVEKPAQALKGRGSAWNWRRAQLSG